MSRKVFNLVSALIGRTQAISIALVTYFSPEHLVAITLGSKWIDATGATV